jgi:hypothetical protein
MVYKTPSGNKYHLESCRMVKNVSQKLSVTVAINQGLQSCKICKPTMGTPNSFIGKRTQGQSNTQQCNGYTKKGMHCQHRTSIGNGYCFQHQP